MPKQFVNWIKSAVTSFIDPDREDRVKALAAMLSRGLKEEQKAFRIDRFKATHEHHPQELNDAVRIVYRRLLERVWSDVSDKENLQLLWVQQGLGLSSKEAMGMKMEFAEEHFRTALARAMDDGCLSAEEETRLAHIAQSVGKSTSAFARDFFRKEGEAFLRGIFSASIEDGSLSSEEWGSLVSTSNRLGITNEELLHAVARPAAEFVEHVLADAKAEERITKDQEARIIWLMSTLNINTTFVTYAKEELRILRCMSEITNGRLPSIEKPDGLELRSGEIVHAVKSARLAVVRHLRSGEHRDLHGSCPFLRQNWGFGKMSGLVHRSSWTERSNNRVMLSLPRW